MKKIISFLSFLGFMSFVVLLVQCQKEVTSDVSQEVVIQQKTVDINKAKAWFESNK